MTEPILSTDYDCWNKRCELRFDALPSNIQDALRAVIQRRSYRPGEAIFHHSEAPMGLHRIDAGVVKVTRQMPDGPERLIVDLRDRGEPLGEETLFDDEPHRTSAWAIDAVDLSFVPRDDLWILMGDCPEFLEQLLRIYAVRLQSVQDRLSLFYFANVESRLAAVVLGLAQRFGRPKGDALRLSVKLHRWDWAQLVGARVETLSRVFGRWADRGWVHNKAGTLILYDADSMTACMAELD